MRPANVVKTRRRGFRAGEPGGCHLTTLCAPAAATSRARLAQRCPAPSVKSSPAVLVGNPGGDGVRPGLPGACSSAPCRDAVRDLVWKSG
jgi:hypothetical protein